jgi:hypothetical protein
LRRLPHENGTQEISHSSITNHRILIRPDEPFPGIAFQQTTAALSDLIHLNPAPGKERKSPPPLVLLQAYGELAEKHPEYLSRYTAVLEQLQRSDPDDPLVQGGLKPGQEYRHPVRLRICGARYTTSENDLVH